MKMTDRIRRLREQSLNAVNRITAERALLITEFYKSGVAASEPVPVQRALSFKYILEHKYICINDGELIVGERGPAPKATPTYPEICIHSMQDLQILNEKAKATATASLAVCHRNGKTPMPQVSSLSSKNNVPLVIPHSASRCSIRVF